MQQWYGKMVSEALNTSYSILNLKMNLFRVPKPGVSFSNASFSGFIYISKISSSFRDALCEAHGTENRKIHGQIIRSFNVFGWLSESQIIHLRFLGISFERGCTDKLESIHHQILIKWRYTKLPCASIEE